VTPTALRSVTAPRPAWLLILGAWLAAYAARPALLGFYYDDWVTIVAPARETAPFGWERFTYHLRLYADRPGTGLLTFLLSSACADSPQRWHLAAALLALLVGGALRSMLRSLLGLLGHQRLWPADVAVASWMVFPWMLGMTAWPTTVPCLAAVAFFALSARALFNGWVRRRPCWLPAGGWLLLSLLTYEAFYGQFLLLMLLGWLALDSGGRRHILPPLAACTGAQLIALGWNRLIALLDVSAHAKQWSPLWWGAFSRSLAGLRYVVGESAAEFSPALEFALLAGVLGWLVLPLTARGPRDQLSRTSPVLACAGVGTVLALLLYSLAGYWLSGVGHGSRTTLTPSFWLAVVLTVILGSLPARPSPVPRIAGVYASLLTTIFAVAINLRLLEWSRAWELERRILAAAPHAALRHAQPGAVVLFEGPYKYKGIRLFDGPGKLDLAMAWAHPELPRLHFCELRADRVTTWDGRRFEQRTRPGFPPPTRRPVWNQYETSEVWLWNSEKNQLRSLSPPFEHPPLPRGNHPPVVAGRPTGHDASHFPP